MLENKLYSPLQKRYWRNAGRALRSVRWLTTAALLTAARIALGSLFIPVGEASRIYISFFATALCAILCGPWLSGISGFTADILGYLLFPSGAFFPGYTLTAILSGMLYALFFYRRPITLLRVFLAKASVNLFINVLLGSVWSAMMFGKAYYYYFAKNLIKNALMCPLETLLLFLFLKAILPILARMKMIPPEQGKVGLFRAATPSGEKPAAL
ncbi:folate family ECF transporter S component [Ruminococcaceae bacterium OttesenSCG-928-N02]|nr:folate family ECF transporter S component [Ruminococcaceae bacterium OttesenSCG-928-N02]